MGIQVPEDRYREIETMIASVDSPVGIDAKKTHVLILHMLQELDRRLQALEARIEGATVERADVEETTVAGDARG